jgi:hypothetical protein
MSKQRSFWLHRTVESVANQKIARKPYLSFLQSNGLLQFLLKHTKYVSVMRKYAYTTEILRLCSAGPMHVTNTSLRRFALLDFFEKINVKYFSYSYIFSTKINHRKYKNTRPIFPVYKGSDLFLTGLLDLSNISDENVIESMFVNKDYISFSKDIFINFDGKINFFFIFDIYILQLVEFYKIVTSIFLYKVLTY